MSQKFKYNVVESLVDLDGFEEIALDFETLGVRDKTVELFSLAAMDDNGNVYAYAGYPNEISKLKRFVKGRKIICHNFKFDGQVMLHAGFDVFNFAVEDTILMANLLYADSLPSIGLKQLTKHFMQYEMAEWKAVDKDDKEAYAKYAVEDAVATIYLFKLFRQQVINQKLVTAYQIEKKAMYPIMFMEHWGVEIDFQQADYLRDLCSTEVERLETDIHMDAGYVFDIPSTQQLGAYLFDELKIPFYDEYLTSKGNRSTSAAVLEGILKDTSINKSQRKAVQDIVEFRRLSKLANTYFNNVLDNARSSADLRCHPDVNQLYVATGRLSMANPNLQQLPARPIIQDKDKDGEYTRMDTHIRSMFVPSEGNLFIGMDYSQIELRMLAHFSEDPKMIEAFERDIDYHTWCADLLKIPRSHAKTVNFGILFGLGPYGLAQQIGCTINEGKKFLADYYKTFPGIPRLRRVVTDSVLTHKYLRTLGGRKRRLIGDVQDYDEGSIQRAFMSHLIQGGAAVVMKLGMIKCFDFVRKTGAKLVLSVHDELLFDVPKNDVKDLGRELQNIMENCIELEVPLKTSLKIGENFAECK